MLGQKYQILKKHKNSCQLGEVQKSNSGKSKYDKKQHNFISREFIVEQLSYDYELTQKRWYIFHYELCHSIVFSYRAKNTIISVSAMYCMY